MTVTVPYIFQDYTAGGPAQVIDAVKINADFQALASAIVGTGGAGPFYYVADHTVTAAEVGALLVANNDATTIIITLPEAGSAGFETRKTVCLLAAGAAGFQLQAVISPMLGVPQTAGVATFLQYGNARCVSDGVNWLVVAG